MTVAPAAASFKELQHLAPAGGIDPVERLIERQDVRLVNQGLGQLGTLAHPLGAGLQAFAGKLESACLTKRLTREGIG